jgi:hypothetical protein
MTTTRIGTRRSGDEKGPRVRANGPEDKVSGIDQGVEGPEEGNRKTFFILPDGTRLFPKDVPLPDWADEAWSWYFDVDEWVRPVVRYWYRGYSHVEVRAWQIVEESGEVLLHHPEVFHMVDAPEEMESKDWRAYHSAVARASAIRSAIENHA